MIPVNDLILDLSKMLFDQRTVILPPNTASNHDYSQELLLLAINRGVRDLLNALYEKETTANIVKAMPEFVVEEDLGFLNGEADMPTTAYKGIALKGTIGSVLMIGIPTPPDKWYSILQGYNQEEVGDAKGFRWTEYNRIVRGNQGANIICQYQYLKNYTDVAISGNIDVNAKYYNQILDLAYAFIMKLSPIQ